MLFTRTSRYLPPEMAKQVERFTGCPYDPEEDARLRAWVAFKRWHHRLMALRDQKLRDQVRDRRALFRLVK